MLRYRQILGRQRFNFEVTYIEIPTKTKAAITIPVYQGTISKISYFSVGIILANNQLR